MEGLSPMVDRTQLQRMARDVEALRKRLDEIHLRMEQVDAVLSEHKITAGALKALMAHEDPNNASSHVSIGSGVSLHYRHQGSEEGIALVDLGAGVFGERHWSDAHAITLERESDIQHLRDELQGQAEQTETNLAQVAQAFNTAAEQLQSLTAAPAEAKTLPQQTASEPEPEPAKPARKGRKRGMFGSDLTLDD
jgi:prefoldin subunit 5